MKPIEAEKLLGGYATGTLTEEERQRLFASALEHQAVFDALMDEEALRELLADPAVKTQLILALAHSAPPNVVPFWRRTGVLGAAASLLVAATAGLAYLRSPSTVPTMPTQEAAKAPAAKAVEAPMAQALAAPAQKQKGVTEPLKEKAEPAHAAEATAYAPPPATAQGSRALGSRAQGAVAQGAPVPVMEDSARIKTQGDLHRAEAQEPMAKKTEAPRPTASAVVEVMSNPKQDAVERKKVAQERSAEGAPGGVPGGVAGGVVGGVVGGGVRPAPMVSSSKAKADNQNLALVAKGTAAPTWRLEAKAEGATGVTVMAHREAHVVLLKRGSSGVLMLKLAPQVTSPGDVIPWRCEIRLVSGDVLDLYVLNHPVADPFNLPETGPVDGFRARIHPSKK